MRKIVLIFIFFDYYNVNGQSHINLKKFSEAKDTIICFYCQIGKSKAVTEVTKLIVDKKYFEVKKLMLSKNAAEKFLAAVTCKKLFALKKLSLTYEEEKLIEKIFNSKENLYTYSNDTYMEIKPIRYYVYDKEDKLIWSQTQSWLEKVIK